LVWHIFLANVSAIRRSLFQGLSVSWVAKHGHYQGGKHGERQGRRGD